MKGNFLELIYSLPDREPKTYCEENASVKQNLNYQQSIKTQPQASGAYTYRKE